jgi:hypothetical protein
MEAWPSPPGDTGLDVESTLLLSGSVSVVRSQAMTEDNGRQDGTAPVLSPSGWAALVGRWAFDDEPGAEIAYNGPTDPNLPYGLAVCDLAVRSGTIRTHIRFDALEGASAGIVLGYKSVAAEYLVVQLGAHGSAYLIARWEPGFGWRTLASAGASANLRPDREYVVKILLRGTKLRLEVDDVRVLDFELTSPMEGDQLGLFAWGPARVVFGRVSVDPERPRLFVAMQFSEPFDTLYREVIKPEAESLGLSVVRIDEVAGPGIVFEDIKRGIEEAAIVVAEITAPNQNVFYELGYAHALNKPTILLAQRGRDLAFDIRGYRVIFYDDSIGGKPTVEKAFKGHLQAILQP